MNNNLSGISPQYNITARRIDGLEDLFVTFGFHVTKKPDKKYTEEYINDIKERMKRLIDIPFSPNGLHDMTNSKRDGRSEWLPYSSYVWITWQREVLCVYFDSSFNKAPFLFMHFRPESGAVILSNYTDIEKLDILRDEETLETYIEDIRIPNKIEHMIAGVDDLCRLSNMFSAIKNYYGERGDNIFEITCKYKDENDDRSDENDDIDDDIDPMLMPSDPRWG